MVNRGYILLGGENENRQNQGIQNTRASRAQHRNNQPWTQSPKNQPPRRYQAPDPQSFSMAPLAGSLKTLVLVLLMALPLGQGLQELGSTQIWWEERDGTELSTAFLANALGYLEVPFAFSGTTRLGMDAIGLLYRAYLETTRQRLPRAMTELLALGTEIATEDIRRGDLVFFRNNGEIYHVGIAMGNDFFLHSAPEGAFRGVKADSLSDNSYGPRYAFARRLFAPQPPRIMVELSGEHNEYILPQNQLRGTDIPLEIRVLGEETRLELLFYRNGRLQYRKYKTLVEGRTWENLHMGLNGEWEIRLLHGNTERGRIRYQVVAGNQQTSE